MRIAVGGTWLNDAGELPTCVLKTVVPQDAEYRNDLSRPENLALLDQLLDQNSPLRNWTQGRPSLVLGGELAHGSGDFQRIRTSLANYRSRLIFISGFGHCTGNALQELLNLLNVHSTWADNFVINPAARYNGGWCWITDGNGGVQCYIFLKNFIEQQYEQAFIPGLLEAPEIARIDTNDLVIFPIVCADLICDRDNSPCRQILNSLQTTPPSATQRVLVTVSSYDHNSRSDYWKAAIGGLVRDCAVYQPKIIIANCASDAPQTDENDDKWRCLSGVHLSRDGLREPREPFPYVRFTNDTLFAGLVLRLSEAGCAIGNLRWTHDTTRGMYPWLPSCRYIWNNNALTQLEGIAAVDELERIIKRYRENAFQRAHYRQTAKQITIAELDSLLLLIRNNTPSEREKLAVELIKRTLLGIDKESSMQNPDKLFHDGIPLNSGLATAVLLKHANDMELLPTEAEHGQLHSKAENLEILVWHSPTQRSQDMHQMVQRMAEESGSAIPLKIIGQGNSGTSPASGRIRSSRLADISTTRHSGEVKDIEDPSERVIYWQNLGEFEDEYARDQDRQALIGALRTKTKAHIEHATAA